MPTYAEMQMNLKHPDPAVRIAAAEWMATCDFDRASIELSQRIVFEKDYWVRKALRIAEGVRADRVAKSRAAPYRAISDPAEALTRALHAAADPSADRVPAIDFLAERSEPEAFALLVKLLNDPHQGVREDAAQALAQQGDEAALPPLIACFTDPTRQPKPDGDGDVSHALAWSITRFGVRAVPYLLPFLENPIEAWRKRILWLMQELDEESTVQPLINAHQRTTDPLAHHTIESALNRIGTPEATAFVNSVRLRSQRK